MGFGGPTGELVALQGGLVAPKELWWPLWCPVRFGGPTGGFGDPKGALVVAVVSPGGLVALQGGLVTPKGALVSTPVPPPRSPPHLCAWGGRWSRNGGTRTAPGASRSAPRKRRKKRRKKRKVMRTDFLLFHPIFVPPLPPHPTHPIVHVQVVVTADGAGVPHTFPLTLFGGGGERCEGLP